MNLEREEKEERERYHVQILATVTVSDTKVAKFGVDFNQEDETSDGFVSNLPIISNVFEVV